MFKKMYKIYSDFYQLHEMGQFKYFFPKDYKHSKIGPLFPSFDNHFSPSFLDHPASFSISRIEGHARLPEIVSTTSYKGVLGGNQ